MSSVQRGKVNDSYKVSCHWPIKVQRYWPIHLKSEHKNKADLRPETDESIQK